MNDFLVDQPIQITEPVEDSTSLVPLEEAVEKVQGGKTNVVMDSQILTTLMACPRLADFRFNMNLVSIGGKSPALECGSIVHAFMETYYKCIIGRMKRDDAFGFGMASAELYIQGCPLCSNFQPTEAIPKPTCNHQPNQYPGVQNVPRENDGTKIGWAWVLATLEQYHLYYRNDFWVPLEVEVVKGRVLYEDDEIRVLWKAKLDLTADTLQAIYPVDHKTMKQRRETNSMNNQFIGQCLLMGTQNVVINKVGFQKTLEPKERFERKMMSYSAERLIEWQSETLPYYAKLLIMYSVTGHFPPNFTHCEGKYGNCAFYREVCSWDPGMREAQLRRHFTVGHKWDIANDDDNVIEGEVITSE